ncbi:hypothetical protein TrVFT333_003535 [Trichoderma virens FT-333]|nr:hypothetical protein TrVFT333_003535 [Trichoderma virens FT-333]
MPSILNIAHMCSHLQNASKARLGLTSIPSNKYNLHLALALHRSGFFSSVYRAGPHPPTPEQMVAQVPEPVTNATVAKMRIWLGLKYWDGRPVLSKATVISKPSRQLTLKGGVVQGLGVGECMFVSTSSGVLEVREALAKKVGGVLMCRVS